MNTKYFSTLTALITILLISSQFAIADSNINQWPTANKLQNELSYRVGYFTFNLPFDASEIASTTDEGILIKLDNDKKLGIYIRTNDYVQVAKIPVRDYFRGLILDENIASDVLVRERRMVFPALDDINIYKSGKFEAIATSISFKKGDQLKRIVVFDNDDPNIVLDILTDTITLKEIEQLLSTLDLKRI